ncbi:MAG: hypothetical protein A2X94_15380 [Bdellovibrionales bacterium GWB1_55_8]|nr:MAG: hypothetical protein A2X94_15380 [Bdellovibrionales bacterium GWB1_55_8]
MKSHDLVILISLALAAGSGCAKSDLLSAESLSISGQLSTATDGGGARVSSAFKVDADALSSAEGLRFASLLSVQALSELTVYCVTFALPPTSGVGSVDVDGKFKVTMEGAKSQQFGCFVMKDEDVVATLVFKDESEKAMDGSDQTLTHAAFDADASFGTIVLDLEKGTAVADLAEVDAVRNVAVASGTEFDPSGSWTIQPVDFILPKGYVAACAGDGQNDECKGPRVGENIFLKRLDGFKYAAGATTAERRYALMVWQSEQSFQACGSKLGFSYAEAKTQAGIDLSLSGVAEGSFDFPVGLEDGWKDVANATSLHEMRACGPVAVVLSGQTKTGWKCVDSGNHYQIHLGGGCVNTADNQSVKLYDWGALNSHESTDLGSGYFLRVSSGTTTIDGVLTSVRCENIGGEFDSAGNACNQGEAGCFDWNNVAVLVAQDQLCSTISTGTAQGQLAQLQCYAQHYWQNQDDDGCLRSIETNYAAESPADFVLDQDGPQKARSEHLLGLMSYGSPNEATIREEGEAVRGARGGNGDYIPCRVFQTTTITFKKVADSKLLVEFIEEQKNLSLDKPACEAEFQNRSMKGMFYMAK